MVLRDFLDADTKGRLSLLVDVELTVRRQFQDLLVVHPVHVVVHEHEPQRHPPALYLVSSRPEEVNLVQK